MRAEQITGPVARHAEGPMWHVDEGVLYFVDLIVGDLLRFDPVHGAPPRRRHVADVLASVRPRRGGGLVAGVERGFALIGADGRIDTLAPLWNNEGGVRVRMNDGGCDPTGRFYCGSMAYDSSPGHGDLHILGADLGTQTALTGVGVSNGLAFSPDGHTAWYVDSLTQRIDLLDHDPDTGRLTGRRPLAHIDRDAGIPDGLALDTEGCVWLALFGGGAVHRYDPDGRLGEVVTVDAPYVTACAFGGPDLADLYITAAQNPPDATGVPDSGALHHVRPGTTGQPVATFAG